MLLLKKARQIILDNTNEKCLLSSPFPPPACAAGPSSVSPPGPFSPAASSGSSASLHERTVAGACCAHSGSPGCGLLARKSSPAEAIQTHNQISLPYVIVWFIGASSPPHIVPLPSWLVHSVGSGGSHLKGLLHSLAPAPEGCWCPMILGQRHYCN